MPGNADPVPSWVVERVSRTHFAGNVRELSNLAERVSLVRRQFGSWERLRLERLFQRIDESHPMALELSARPGAQAAAQTEDLGLGSAELAERERILQALDDNAWRRQDSAAQLGISRKVLWEKMRKYQIAARGESVAIQEGRDLINARMTNLDDLKSLISQAVSVGKKVVS